MYFKAIAIFVNLVILANNAIADIYMHNPRGSNNRLDEQGRERATNNRVFDSENNARGGYNVGNMFYYVGSHLPIEWTNQHSCASPNANCEIIIQYMCSDNLRDGTDVRQIPQSNSQCDNNDCNTDYRFGMHESYDSYMTCRRRARNKGLFIAEQKVGPTAMNTRQNPNGGASGTECSEERDYYPYWHPTQWIDIAVLTNNISRCAYYKAESENVKSRWYCVPPQGYIDKTGGLIPNNKNECEALTYNGTKAVWVESPSHGVNAPVCKETQYTRDNHLGNTYGANPPVFNWTIPNTPNENCALRIRYNISTNDYDSWSTFSESNSKTANAPANINIYSTPDSDLGANRGFVFTTNPEVKIFPGLDFKLKLAINTAQYGRVFQDRSHQFAIRSVPSELNNQVIKNLNVRGKRGNIVQVYPGVEYDFVPNNLAISKNSYIHFQWTGSNTNPANNAGQGVAGTDRNNLVVLTKRNYSKGFGNAYTPLLVSGDYGVNYPEQVSTASFLNISKDSLINLAILRPNQYGGSMDELNDAGTYFELKPQKVTSAGVIHYMCTRNNNFSNRDQKGQIVCYDYAFTGDTIGRSGGNLVFSDAVLEVPQNAFNSLQYVEIDSLTSEQLKAKNLKSQIKEADLASNYIILSPIEDFANEPITLKIKTYTAQPKNKISVYRLNPDFSIMTKLTANVENEYAIVQTQTGGIFIVKAERNYGVLIGSVVGAVVFLIIVVSIITYLVKNPKYCKLINDNANVAKRSLKDQI